VISGPSPLIDTHCHLDLPHFDPDRERVLERAAAAGVGIIINPAIDLASCRRVLALARQYSNIYAAIGVHPNDCANFSESTLQALYELAQHPRVVAIGEIGLDYYWQKVPVAQQKRALRDQLALAAELGLPVILHSRRSSAGDDTTSSCNADLLEEVGQWLAAAPNLKGGRAIIGVWHAFSGDLAEAQAAYELGLVLGLGGPVTFQNARRLHALVPSLDPHRLILETDAPYLAPHPYRGQRNEPGYVALVAQSLANLYAMPADKLARMTTATAVRLFRLPPAATG